MHIEIASSAIPTNHTRPVTFHTAASATPEEIGISFAPSLPKEEETPQTPSREDSEKAGGTSAVLYGGEGDLYQRVRAPYFGKPQPIRLRNTSGCPMAALPQDLQLLQEQPLTKASPLTPGGKTTVTPREKFFGEPQPLRVNLSGMPACSANGLPATSSSCTGSCSSCAGTQFSTAVPAPVTKPAGPAPELPRSPLDAHPDAFGDNLALLRKRSAGFDYEAALSVSSRHYRSPLLMLLLTIFFGGALGLDRFCLRSWGAGFLRLLLTAVTGTALILSFRPRGIWMAVGGVLALLVLALWISSVRSVRSRTVEYNTYLFLSSIPRRPAGQTASVKQTAAPSSPVLCTAGYGGFSSPVTVVRESAGEDSAGR